MYIENLSTNLNQSQTSNLLEIERAADNGDLLSQYRLAMMYRKGDGVSKNYERAIKYYKLSANQGHVISQISLGLIYKKGDEVEQDLGQAFIYFKMGANQNHYLAQYYLGLAYYLNEGVGQDYNQAFKYFKLSAKQDYHLSQVNLACMFYWGTGIEKNNFKAFKYFKQAAIHGHANAQFYLGALLKNGEGIQKNDNEAFKYFKLSADQGNIEAQYNLAIMYESGQGVEQNYEEALKYYKLSAIQGHAKAQYCLGTVYDFGIGAEQNYLEAIKYYELAAKNGIAGAYSNLGIMYENGEGVEKNHEKACKNFQQAADRGHTMAQYYLDLFFFQSPEGMKWIEIKNEIQKKYHHLKNEIVEKNNILPSIHNNLSLVSGNPQFCYGGVHGNNLFQELTKEVILSELLEFLQKSKLLLSSKLSHSHAENYRTFFPIFYSFLTLAGNERGFIAQCTETLNSEKFGTFLQNNESEARIRETCRYIHDPVEGWDAWYNLVTKKLKDVLSNLLITQGKSQINLNAGKYLITANSGEIFTFFIQNIEDKKYNSQFFLFPGDKNLEDHELGKLDSSFYCWNNFPGPIIEKGNESLGVKFTYLLTQQGIDSLMPKELKCIHLAAHQSYFKMAEALLSAILWDPKKQDIDQLKTSAGQFYWHFIHSSIFCRGQAAISDWIIQSIFKLHNYNHFSWPLNWQAPYAAPDQQALTFSRNQFVESFKRTVR